jgi:hypothetical protein
MRRLAVALVLLLILVVRPSLGDERIGSFAIFDDAPDAIFLLGPVTINAPLEFRRALTLRPEARIVVLDSPGGLVPSALLIADDIHQRGLSTAIPKEFGCYSACAFIFFAGRERLVEGELGVHQMASDEPDPEGMQYTISDLLEALEKYDVSGGVITRMFRTPAEEMYVFSTAEIEDLGLNRLMPDSSAPATTPPPVSPAPEPPAQDQTLKLALYSGLDFYGSDVQSSRANDAVQCAQSCMDHSQCVVFTFNANPNARSGPNCFLKSGIGRLEAYKQAFSGFLFMEGEAPIFDIGGIDPTANVQPNQFASGTPLRTLNGIELGTCRMNCVDTERCRAFSYSVTTRQCRLLSTLTGFLPRAGFTSGAKQMMSFAPVDVINLSE